MTLIKQLPNKSDKIIAFTMIYLSSLYGDSEGEFNAKVFTINRLTGISDQQVGRVINKLIKLNYIECIYRNRLKPIEYGKRKYIVSKYPNKFKLDLLQSLQSDNEQIIYRFDKVDTKVENILKHFWTCFDDYLIKSNLKPSRREKENIKYFQKIVDKVA